jgi:hypothetical protein
MSRLQSPPASIIAPRVFWANLTHLTLIILKFGNLRVTPKQVLAQNGEMIVLVNEFHRIIQKEHSIVRILKIELHTLKKNFFGIHLWQMIFIDER